MPLKSRAPRVSSAPSTLKTSPVSHTPSTSRLLVPFTPPKSRVPLKISRPLKPLTPLGSRVFPCISRPLQPLRSCAPPQISRPSGLAGPTNLATPRPRSGPACPAPRAHVSLAVPAAGGGGGGGRRTHEAARPPSPAPSPPTHFSRAWLSEGTVEPFPPLAYMLLRAAAAAAAAAAGAHTCQAAPRAALVVSIATLRPGPHRPEPRAATAGIVRAGELQTAEAAAAAASAWAPAAGFIFFLSSLSESCSGKRAPPLPAARAPARLLPAARWRRS